MRIDLATVTVFGALQTGLTALVLLVATRRYPGSVRNCLRMRALALALEATGWLLFALRSALGDGLSIAAGNALVLVSNVITVGALRLLLGVPPRWMVTALGCLAGYLGLLWFALAQPDYRLRVYCVTAALALCLGQLLWPLAQVWRRQGSAAGRMLFVTLSVSALLAGWRVAELVMDRSVSGLLDPARVNTLYTLYVLLAVMQPLFTSIGFLLLHNERVQSELETLARIDPLTGVNNRLALSEWIDRLCRRAVRKQRPFAALMLDADHFKSINDRFGHAGGDKVLLSLVDAIHASIGARDVVGRVGGEEFVVLAPDTDMAAAMALAERVRQTVAASVLRVDGRTLALTVSIGVSVAWPGEGDAEALLARADAALYAAKRAGRNCVMSSATAGSVPFLPVQVEPLTLSGETVAAP